MNIGWALVPIAMTLAWLLPLVPRYTKTSGARMWTTWLVSSSVAGVVVGWSANRADVGTWTMIGLGFAIVPMGALFTIDVFEHRLPRQIALTATVPLILLAMIESGPASREGVLIAAGINTLIALGLRWATRGSLGQGDVMVSPMLGALVGCFDPWSLATLWLSASILGAVWSIGLIMSGRRSKSDHIAYGPFLIVGALAAVWWSVV